MDSGKTVLAQILAGLGNKEFPRCEKRYPMPSDTPALSAYDHFAVMVFAQLTYRESAETYSFPDCANGITSITRAASRWS